MTSILYKILSNVAPKIFQLYFADLKIYNTELLKLETKSISGDFLEKGGNNIFKYCELYNF